MPDPQKDIAPIIEPAAPPMAASGPDYVLPAILGVSGVLLVAMLAWRWHRRAPLRSLRKLSQEQDPVKAANKLAELIRKQRIELSSGRKDELERLRFGPAFEDAADTLESLCQEAEIFLKAR